MIKIFTHPREVAAAVILVELTSWAALFQLFDYPAAVVATGAHLPNFSQSGVTG